MVLIIETNILTVFIKSFAYGAQLKKGTFLLPGKDNALVGKSPARGCTIIF